VTYHSEHPTFSVDTNLFRELGELLVGRDSTALVELIKNAYDADATEVVLYGEALSDRSRGYIRLADNGIGMSREEFENGFLRIAARGKNEGDRRSLRLGRRYTGAKGVGRLAAHKLAHVVEVMSWRWDGNASPDGRLRSSGGVQATIRWDVIEKLSTLDQLVDSDAITVKDLPTGSAAPGTTITLRSLRQAWTPVAHGRFLQEVQTFETPRALSEPLPKAVIGRQLLFKTPKVRDASVSGANEFNVRLEGDLESPEGFWKANVEAAQWILEIDADETSRTVRFGVAPTKQTADRYPDAERQVLELPHPAPSVGPFFQSRILIRGGRSWEKRSGGVRVFMESFRVLPFGEPGNDWLSLDRDVTERGRNLGGNSDGDDQISLPPTAGEQNDTGLILLPAKHYFGAIFLTQSGGRALRMLVNREGFVPDAAYECLVSLVRLGIDLASRARAAATAREREERRETRRKAKDAAGDDRQLDSAVLRASIGAVRAALVGARELVRKGDAKQAEDKVREALGKLEEAADVSEDIIGEAAMLRVLASVGTQMSAFIHEINGLVGTAASVDRTLRHLRGAGSTRERSRALSVLSKVVSDMRRRLEREASYLVDVLAPDARRRRARQRFADQFEAGKKLITGIADAHHIAIENGIPASLLSPPMFAAELVAVFSNLLTNAVKASGERGRVRATARRTSNGIELRIENTGAAIDLKRAERWFRPFESSTARVDAVLGQGMGLGLPITRGVLHEYGATIRFVAPSKGFATAVELLFPG
jgi:signal transduction histidine kinase